MLAILKQTVNQFAGLKSDRAKKALVPVLFFHHNMSSQTPKSVPTGAKPTEAKTATPGATSKAPYQNLSKNLSLFPHSPQANEFVGPKHKPLVVLLNWMLAKRKHVMKYGDFYRNQGFDVLSVTLTPLQLLWPVSGAQLVADDVLKFLVDRAEYQSIVIHGFSVGGYLYGEMLAKMLENPDKYKQLISKIAGQVFDSAVDYENIPIGLSKAVTNNRSIQKCLQMYISYHMRLFYIGATQHYLRSSQMFHNNIVRSPSLFLFSRDDPVGTAEGNMKVLTNWEKNGVQVYVKCWNSSPHVSHLHHHPEEYMEELEEFLDKIDHLAVRLEPLKKASKL